jgi:DUF4097 and DUF4098 domain-containing protein YvlB
MNSIHGYIISRATWLAALLGAASVLASPEVREEYHQTFPLQKSGKVQLENVNGGVHIVAWDQDQVKVDAVKRAKDQTHLDEVKIEVEAKDGHLSIKTKYPEAKKGKHDSGSVDYTLTVPAQCVLDEIRTVNGGIQIEKVGGNVTAKTVNGAVSADGLSGKVELSTVNGALKAGFAELKQEVSLKSVNGAITIVLPPGAKADLSAKTVNGGVSCDFPIEVKKQIVGQNIEANLGEGGPAIKLSSVNGGIAIKRGTAIEAEK